MRFRWKPAFLGLVAVIGAVVLSWLALARSPGFRPVGSTAYRLVAGDTLVKAEIEPFTATYRRTTKILGFIPISVSPATLSVQLSAMAAGPGLDVTIVLGDSGAGVEDRILLDRRTLAPLRRTFDLPSGGTVSVEIEGDRITGSVTQGTTVRDVAFDYESPVFEVSLLELLFASIPLADGFNARLAWDNMQDADAMWADVRVAGDQRVLSLDGKAYDTKVVHVRFASGNRRWFWIAREPPYKIRVANFSRGRALYTIWNVKSATGG